MSNKVYLYQDVYHDSNYRIAVYVIRLSGGVGGRGWRQPPLSRLALTIEAKLGIKADWLLDGKEPKYKPESDSDK
jgi:hypothetical protein